MENSKKTNPVSFVLSLGKGYGIFFAVALTSMIISLLLGLLTPKVFRFTVDSIIGGLPADPNAPEVRLLALLGDTEALRANLFLVAGLLVLIAVFSAVFTYLSRSLMVKWSEGTLKTLRDKLYSHIQSLPFIKLSQTSTGDLIQRCTADVETFRTFLSGQVPEIFRTVFMLAFTVSAMFSENVRLSLVALAFLPLLFGYSAVFYGKISSRFQKADEAEGLLTQTAQENLTGIRIVKAFGREKFETDRFNDQLDNYSSLWIKLGAVMGAYWGMGDLITGLQAVAVIAYGTFLAVNPQTVGFTLGNFLAFAMYNTSLVWPIRSFGRILSEAGKASVSISRIKEILDSPPETDAPDAAEPDLDGDIVFDRVSFGYGGKNVLNDISFTIPAFSTVGIIGSTGSGKSTIAQLIAGLYEPPEGSGTVSVGGHDIRKIKKAHLRKNISIVLQEPFLFSKTLEENIRISDDSLSLEQVKKAAAAAELERSVSRFTMGYDTLVGERGVTLSGGQKQRTAIARAIITDPTVIIFDDSLSAVDAVTDAKIRRAIKNREKKSTTIIIAHRINSVMHADKIIVMGPGGRIADTGTHEELISRPGIYRDVYEIQHGISESDEL